MHFLGGVHDEKMSSVLSGLDAVLIVGVGVPKCPDLLLIPRFGLSRDRWVVFVEGGVVLVKRDLHPGLILVGRIRKDEAGGFSRF